MWELCLICSQGLFLLRCKVFFLWENVFTGRKKNRKNHGSMNSKHHPACNCYIRHQSDLRTRQPRYWPSLLSRMLKRIWLLGRAWLCPQWKSLTSLVVAMATGSLAEPLRPDSTDSGCRHQLRVSGWDPGCQINHMFCGLHSRPLKLFHTGGMLSLNLTHWSAIQNVLTTKR